MSLSVLHLANHCDRGGNVHLAVDLACGQAAAGDAVIFASAGGRHAALLERNGVRHLTIRQSLRAPLPAARDALRLLSQCRALRPDVIHAHMMSGAVLGKALSRLIGTPLVTTVHNSFDRHSGLMKLGDMVIAISQTERALLLSRGFAEARLRVILNGTLGSPRSTERTDPVPLPRPCVTTLCGLERRKGVHDVIEAFARVADRVPDWRLVIAGEGPERQALERQAAATGCATRIAFIGHVETPMGLLRQSEIFVQASYAEPFCLSILEARAAGCAVIGTRVGGIAEQLGPDRYGKTVPPGRPDLLAEALVGLMSDPAALAEARHRAREDLDLYRVERMARDHAEAYHALLQQRQAAARNSLGNPT